MVLLIWGIFSMTCLGIGYISGITRPPNYVRFTEFFTCEGLDPSTGLPREPKTTFSSTTEAIYVCGYLEVDGSVFLSLILFYEEEAVNWFGPSRRYTTGYVLEEIPHQMWRDPGHYRVEALWGRRKVAFTEFTIVENYE